MRKIIFTFCFLAFVIPLAVRAEIGDTELMEVTDALVLHSWWDSWRSSLRATWKSDDYAVIVPFNTYHVRSTYSKDNIERYNEKPWGLGIEKYYVDEKRNRHSFYALVFSESYARAQTNIGYAWEKCFYLDDAGDMRIGIGYNATITSRYRQNYIPFPGTLPMMSVNYKFLSVQTTWVPYIHHNNGNVFLTMFKVGF